MDISANIDRAMQRIDDIRSRLSELESPNASAAPYAPVVGFESMVRSAQGKAPGTKRAAPADIEALIQSAAQKHNLRPELLRAVVQAESGFNSAAVSPKGAMGLMQLMPGTAQALGVGDAFDPEQNVMGGALYLRQQLDRFGGDESLALAAYNAGPGAVTRYHGVPPFPETQQYVSRILSLASSGE